MQLEEAPPVDTFAGNMLISSHIAYVLVDTGATHACISKKFMSECKLSPEVISDSVMCVSIPFGCESLLTRICRSVDVLLEDVHMSIDMLVMPITDYDIVLGLNWLTKYEVVLDCPRMKLSLSLVEEGSVTVW